MNKLKKPLIVVGVLLVVLTAAILLVTISRTREAEPSVAPYLQSSDTVLVEEGRWLTFMPAKQQPKVGFIFYPGGNVVAPAYTPTLHHIAESGFLVVGVPMPLNMAFLGANKASKVIAAHGEIKNWVIGGHSLGGAMASRFAYQHPGEVAGLALWASYPAESNPLTGTDIQVISIFATLDGLATVREVEASIPLLPEDTVFVSIEGGNHAQFGFYGSQKGDMTPMITQDDQQKQIVDAMVDFLKSFE